MPRLLILCEYPTLLGGERSMLATLRNVAADFDVIVAAPRGGELADALRKRCVPHIPLRTHDDQGERLPLSELRHDVGSVLSATRPDLAHANSLSMSRIVGPVTAERGIRSIGHLRDILNLSRQAMADLSLHFLLIAVSNATRDFHIAQGLSGNCVVLYNGVDLNAFQPRQRTGYLHRELTLSPAARLIAVIGQLGLRKGTEVALAAAAQVVANVPNVHWLIVGERTSHKAESREFEAQLHATANQPPLAGHVHFLGQRSDVCDLLNECDLLVHAARQEPLGRVLLESAASGLPVVATDVGGTREIFPTETDGAVLVPADDAKAIANAVGELLQDDQRRRLLGQGGRRRAEKEFGIIRASNSLVDTYRMIST